MSALGLAQTYASLLRWLGPWTAPDRRPAPALRRTITVAPRAPGDRPFDAWLLAPRDRPPIGAFVVCPGLHYLGPADPRLERFLEVLAASGFLVLAPFLPDFLDLRVDPRVIDDLDRAFVALTAQPELPRGVKPGIFSISFGSLPTLRVAASAARRDAVGAVVLFGGYADWGRTIRFCLGNGEDGAAPKKRDPLNQPVVLMNLLDHLPGRPADPGPLIAAWRRYVESTWGRPELKAPERWQPLAEAAGADLPPDARALYRVGCGLDPGALELCTEALRRQGDARAFLDPRPHLGALRCRVVLCHGMDDDVIPYTEVHALAAALPPEAPRSTYVTGLYGHTGAASLGELLGRASELVREGATLIGMLRAIVRASRQRG